jgi:hypothetical protein
MKLIGIGVHGCDDSTYAVIEATEDQIEFLKRVAMEINDNSHKTCEPRFSVNQKFPKSLSNEVNE